MVVVKANGVSIRYMVGDFKDIGLKDFVVQKISGNYHVEEFWADKDVTFELEKGDMLGIIGTNGAGKSTLLKAVSGIMIPTRGTMETKGSIAALLELTSGFDKDLTVRENTYLRGAMLGYTREFMNEKYDEIIKFAELENFQERAFKQLSSGMKSRLAFSIACLVKPDIIILDEVLSVGDGAFRQKSGDKMREILSNGVTGILVSHSVAQVRDLCNKILWLDHGKQIAFTDDVTLYCDAYEEFLINKALPKNKKDIEKLAKKHKERLERERKKKEQTEAQKLQHVLESGSSDAALTAALNIVMKNNADLLTDDAKGLVKVAKPEDKPKTVEKATREDFFASEKIQRINGNNRYETSLFAAASLQQMLGVNQFDNILVASGDTFADALSGSFLANKLHAPIILVESCSENPDAKPSQDTIDYIESSIKPNGKLYLLGSTAAVSSVFEKTMCMELSENRVNRIAGETVYETNIKILQTAGITENELFVCDVHDFANSASVSALGKPLLLVSGNDVLRESQKAFLKDINVEKIYVVGKISTSLVDELKELKKSATIEEITGQNAYEISTILATKFVKGNKGVVIATGENFPDELCAGPLAYAINSPLVLTHSSEDDFKYLKKYASDNKIENILVLGGYAAINENLISEL